MKRDTKYVFLDVHSAMTVGTVRSENGRVLARMTIPTAAGPLVEVFRGMAGSVHVAFEEGTQAQWLHDLLVPVVDRVVVCDRRGETRRGNKSDKLDADQGSELLRRGALREVYHGGGLQRGQLKEMARAYLNVIEDGTRVMLRLKALFRARGIRTPGKQIYDPQYESEWVAKLQDGGAQFRAKVLYAELKVLRKLRPKVSNAFVAQARRDPAYARLRTIPYLGPIRVALLLAILQTPWRFRTKRSLWGYAGLAVVTHSSADYEMVKGRVVRRRRAPLTRGLNRNHNRIIKNVFKSAASAATGRPGSLQDFYRAMTARSMRDELARVTLARKLSAVFLRLWKTGERYDPAQLTLQAH